MSKFKGTKSYQFTVTGDTVTAVYEIRGTSIKQESIDLDETYTVSGRDIIKTELEHGREEITTYSDPDGDGYYVKSGERHDSSTLARTSSQETWGYFHEEQDSYTKKIQDQYKFLLGSGDYADGDLVDAGETVFVQYELGRRGWKLEELDSDETITVQEVANEAFIVKSELERNGSFEFSVYNDLDGDGIWQEVLEGHAAANHATAGVVDLVGLVSSNLVDPTMLGI